MIEIGIVADDLTGAADTTAVFSHSMPDNQLIAHGQLGKVNPASDLKLLSIYTNSRELEPSISYKRHFEVFTKLRQMNIRWIYKKVDSSLRGNIGAEIDAALDALGMDFSVVAPAYPSLGRTTQNGVHLIHGVPVGQSEVACDPTSPVRLSELPEITARHSRYPVEHISMQRMTDANIIAAEMDRHLKNGIRHITFDAVNEDHLDKLLEAVLSRKGKKALLVGSAGLAERLAAKILPSVPVEDRQSLVIRRPRLLVCGSASIQTRWQTEHLVDTKSYHLVELEAEFLTQLKQPVAESLLSEILTQVMRPSVPGLVVRIAPRNERSDLTAKAAMVMHGLGLYVARLLPALKPCGLFLSGGDTASEILTAIDGRALCVKRTLMPGIIESEIVGGNMHGLPLYTKAGAFGQPDDLSKLDSYWNKTMRRT